MTGTNAELIVEARQRARMFGEATAIGSMIDELADALEAAEAALSAEKRDAALAEKHWHRDKADLDFIAAERDAALAVTERVRVELEDVAEDTPSIPDVNEWADGYRVSNALEVIWAHRGAAK